MPRIAAWILVVAVVLGVIASFWIAGELHYRNCLNQDELAAKSQAPWTAGVAPDGSECSRWPL